jgi:hypothetical protein
VLDLLSIDANAGRDGNQAFSFVGARAFSGAGQVRLARVDGDTVVQGSTDGDGAPEFEILLANGAHPGRGRLPALRSPATLTRPARQRRVVRPGASPQRGATGAADDY